MDQKSVRSLSCASRRPVPPSTGQGEENTVGGLWVERRTGRWLSSYHQGETVLQGTLPSSEQQARAAGSPEFHLHLQAAELLPLFIALITGQAIRKPVCFVLN